MPASTIDILISEHFEVEEHKKLCNWQTRLRV